FPSDSVGYCSAYENVLKTTDGGENWFYPNPDFEGYPYRSIVFEDDNIGFGCFTDNGAAFARTTDGGYTWSEEYEYGGREIIKVDNCQYQMIEGYFHKSDNCWNEQESIPMPIDDRYDENIACSDDEILLSCGLGYNVNTISNFGFVSKSIDDGINWSIIDFYNIYALRSIVWAHGTTFYCVGQPYYPNPFSFLKTTDSGATWSYQTYDLPCSECYSPEVRDVFCASENLCYAVSSNGAIWRTSNGGGEMFPLPVGIDVAAALGAMVISPNPATSTLTIQNLPLGTNQIKILDTTGRILSTHQNQTQIDISNLPSGIYLIEIITDESRTVLQFVKE
ncbi:MAG: T9SS type A sorting domain-containing protein, partial [Flavobacteriales bacterium]